MLPKTQKSLNDVLDASAKIVRFTTGLSLAQYEQDDLVRAAVERQFEIIGETMRRIAATEPEITHGITDYRAIIGFRNLLAHGYDIVDNERVWFVLTVALPRLHDEIEHVLSET